MHRNRFCEECHLPAHRGGRRCLDHQRDGGQCFFADCVQSSLRGRPFCWYHEDKFQSSPTQTVGDWVDFVTKDLLIAQAPCAQCGEPSLRGGKRCGGHQDTGWSCVVSSCGEKNKVGSLCTQHYYHFKYHPLSMGHWHALPDFLIDLLRYQEDTPGSTEATPDPSLPDQPAQKDSGPPQPPEVGRGVEAAPAPPAPPPHQPDPPAAAPDPDPPRPCAGCGKLFPVDELWVYRDASRLFCADCHPEDKPGESEEDFGVPFSRPPACTGESRAEGTFSPPCARCGEYRGVVYGAISGHPEAPIYCELCLEAAKAYIPLELERRRVQCQRCGGLAPKGALGAGLEDGGLCKLCQEALGLIWGGKAETLPPPATPSPAPEPPSAAPSVAIETPDLADLVTALSDLVRGLTDRLKSLEDRIANLSRTPSTSDYGQNWAK